MRDFVDAHLLSLCVVFFFNLLLHFVGCPSVLILLGWIPPLLLLIVFCSPYVCQSRGHVGRRVDKPIRAHSTSDLNYISE